MYGMQHNCNGETATAPEAIVAADKALARLPPSTPPPLEHKEQEQQGEEEEEHQQQLAATSEEEDVIDDVDGRGALTVGVSGAGPEGSEGSEGSKAANVVRGACVDAEEKRVEEGGGERGDWSEASGRGRLGEALVEAVGGAHWIAATGVLVRAFGASNDFLVRLHAMPHSLGEGVAGRDRKGEGRWVEEGKMSGLVASVRTCLVARKTEAKVCV